MASLAGLAFIGVAFGGGWLIGRSPTSHGDGLAVAQEPVTSSPSLADDPAPPAPRGGDPGIGIARSSPVDLVAREPAISDMGATGPHPGAGSSGRQAWSDQLRRRAGSVAPSGHASEGAGEAAKHRARTARAAEKLARELARDAAKLMRDAANGGHGPKHDDERRGRGR